MNGKLVEENNIEYCKCDKGYTGTFCSTKVDPLLYESLPYGEYYNNDRSYYSRHEIYKDTHPFFNLSTISTIKIYINETDLLKLIDPREGYSNE